MRNSYKNAGVDVEAGYKAVSLMKKHIESTFSGSVISRIGGFGGLFSLKEMKNYDDPVLCAATDGVGTKLKIAFIMDKHDTVGIDCVAMCVNDIICTGAKPLFFLDYIACGKNWPEKIEEIVKGVAKGCHMGGVSLIGGETAEMPDFYNQDEYDIAGFAVGIVDRAKIIDGGGINEGDSLIGIASSGLHSNGFSLVRSILRPNNEKVNEVVGILGQSIGNALLEPTKIYVKPVLKLIERDLVKGIVNITGGGFFENIPRMLPENIGALIDTKLWEVPPVFRLIGETGKIPVNEMFGVFNMGVGMILAVSPENTEAAIKSLEDSGERAFVIGKTVKGKNVELC